MFEIKLVAVGHCDPVPLAMFDEPIPAEVEGYQLVVLT